MKEVNGSKANPAQLDIGKAGKCNPAGIRDSRSDSSDRNQSAK